jgi:hypothetical protein
VAQVKYLILAALAAILMIIPASAAKPVPSGTIAIAAGYTAALGEDLLFDFTADIGNQNPRIQVNCYQAGAVTSENPTGLVYGEARDAEAGSSNNSQPFAPLGGASSDWLTTGGPAECVATLYFWDFHPTQTFVPLAEIAFSAGG